MNKSISTGRVNKMGTLCEVCGKKAIRGNKVSHANNKTKKQWKPNIQKIRVVEAGSTKRKYVCTSCIKSNTIQKP